jgi:hypothetical protein
MITGRQCQCAVIWWNYGLDYEREGIIFSLLPETGLWKDVRYDVHL